MGNQQGINPASFAILTAFLKATNYPKHIYPIKTQNVFATKRYDKLNLKKN